MSLHPLGHGANPAENQHIPANRKYVSRCLEVYYAGSLGKTINKDEHRSTAKTGRELADAFTSRLELASALPRLQRERPDLWQILGYRFGLHLTLEGIGERLGLGRNQVRRELDAALDWLITVIFVDDGDGR